MIAKTRPAKTVLFALAVWFPFEDFVLKWAPVPDDVYSVLRLVSELTIYALWVAIVGRYLLRHGRLRRTTIDVPLILFAVCTFLAILASGAPWLGSLITFRTLVRYVAVFHIVVHIGADEVWIRKVVRAVVVVALVQASLALVQYVAGDAFGTFFHPRPTTLEVAGYQRRFTALTTGLEIGAVMGTVGQGVPLALFLLVGLALIAGRAITAGLNRRVLLFCLLLVVAIALTYSRAITLAAIIVIPVAGIVSHSRRWWKRLALAGSLAGVGLFATTDITDSGGRLTSAKDVEVSALENLSAVSDVALWRANSTTRLWMLRDVGSAAIEHRFFGYGSDKNYARQALVRDTNWRLARLIEYHGFEDVFWVAMLVYYGVPGVLLFWWLLARLFRVSRRTYRNATSPVQRQVALTVSTLVLLSFPLALVNSAFEARTFSYYFWLLAGIAHMRWPEASRSLAPQPVHYDTTSIDRTRFSTRSL